MRTIHFLLWFISVFAFSGTAFACTNPTANAGRMIYNADHNVFQGCTPGGWVAFGGG